MGNGVFFDGRDGRDTKRVYATVTGYLLLYFVLSRLFSLIGGACAGGGFAFLRYVLPPFAYLVPLFVSFSVSRGARLPLLSRPSGRGVWDAMPLLPLFLVAVTACAYLTGLAMDGLGIKAEGGAGAGLGFLPDLFLNCFVPALLEELFFRGLLLSLLWQRLGRSAIWLSAVLFALAHGSLYQLPYAFVGGVFLSLAAVVSGSVFVPFLFHFLNNFLSLALQYTPRAWAAGDVAVFLVYTVVAVAAIASFLYLAMRGDSPSGAGIRALFASPRESGRAVFEATVATPHAIYVVLMLIMTVGRALS